jgi:hypothetical protein
LLLLKLSFFSYDESNPYQQVIMDTTFTQRWIRKFRILTLSLIFSGALNIGLVAAFVAVFWQNKQPSFAFAQAALQNPLLGSSNAHVIKELSHLSFRELCACLTNKDLLEEGYTKRDLALAVLGTYRHIDIEKALAGSLCQRRILSLGPDQTIKLYPGLSDEQFKAIIQFVYLEKWPLTPEGLFKMVQKTKSPRESTLEAAFSMTPQFYALQLLFQKTDAPQEPSTLIRLASEGSWDLLDRFTREQTQMLDLSIDKRRRLLLGYLSLRSAAAADLLLQTDFAFVLKKLDDQGIVDMLDLLTLDEIEPFCKALLESPRSDAVWERSLIRLYALLGEPLPQPLNLREAVSRFAGKAATPSDPPPLEEAKSVEQPSWTFYTVQEGDTLWKIARLHQIKIDELVKVNELEKDRLYPGMKLRIPL